MPMKLKVINNQSNAPFMAKIYCAHTNREKKKHLQGREFVLIRFVKFSVDIKFQETVEIVWLLA